MIKMSNQEKSQLKNAASSLCGGKTSRREVAVQESIDNEDRRQAVNIEEFIRNKLGEQTIELAIMAVKQNGLLLKHIKEELRTPQVVKFALRQNGRAIAYVSNPTEEQRVLAVQTNPHAISEIKNKTKKVCLEAVKRNGLVLNYIQNQTKEVCLEAIRQNPIAMRFVRPGVYDKELFSIAFEQDWRLLEFVPKEMQDIEIAMVAYQQNPEAEKYFKF